jgi:hypothetical protein
MFRIAIRNRKNRYSARLAKNATAKHPIINQYTVIPPFVQKIGFLFLKLPGRVREKIHSVPTLRKPGLGHKKNRQLNHLPLNPKTTFHLG